MPLTTSAYSYEVPAMRQSSSVIPLNRIDGRRLPTPLTCPHSVIRSVGDGVVSTLNTSADASGQRLTRDESEQDTHILAPCDSLVSSPMDWRRNEGGNSVQSHRCRHFSPCRHLRCSTTCSTRRRRPGSPLMASGGRHLPVCALSFPVCGHGLGKTMATARHVDRRRLGDSSSSIMRLVRFPCSSTFPGGNDPTRLAAHSRPGGWGLVTPTTS